MTNKLKNRLALITGATRGIGAAVAERFAQEGADLILVGRKSKDLEKIDDRLSAYPGSRTLVPLDLRRFEGIHEMAQVIAERFKRLDILVGNAGVLGTLGPIHHLKPTLWHEVMDINLSANWHLLQAFDPLLRASDAGRGIFVTSSVGCKVSPYFSAYSVSKAALNNMVKLYAAENTKTPVKINLISPGPIRTQMRATAMPGEDPLTIPAPEEITDIFLTLASESCPHTGEIFNRHGEVI